MSQESNKYPLGSFTENLACCDDGPSIPPPPGEEDCVDHWEAARKMAAEEFDKADAIATKFSDIYNDHTAWEEKLKALCEDIVEADKKAKAIALLLKGFIRKIYATRRNATKTKRAIQAVLCLVKYIHESIVELLRICPPDNDEGLLQILKHEVECNPNLDEKVKQEIIDCILVFEAKIRLVHETQATVLEELLKMLDMACAILKYLDDKKYGLEWQLRDLLHRILGKEKRNENIRRHCGHRHEDPDELCKVNIPPCGDQVFKPDQKLFPIEDSQYCADVKDLYDKAQKRSMCLKDVVEEANEDRARELDCRTQYENAVEAAKKAEGAT